MGFLQGLVNKKAIILKLYSFIKVWEKDITILIEIKESLEFLIIRFVEIALVVVVARDNDLVASDKLLESNVDELVVVALTDKFAELGV